VKQLALIVLGALLAPVAGFTASFDCRKAVNAVEKMVCADAKLSQMDDDLGALYAGAMELAADKDARAKLLDSQRTWLRDRNRCADSDCVLAAYGSRYAALRAGGPAHSYRRIAPTRELGIVEDPRLCERFIANLRAAHAEVAPNCELRIAPRYAKYFSLPQWEELDPWQHLDWLWQMDTDANSMYYIANKLERLQQDQKAWEAWFKERMERQDHGPWVPAYGPTVGQRLHLRLLRGRFDLDSDGKVDTVLAYRIAPSCDPETSDRGGAGYHSFVLDPGKGQVRLAHFEVRLSFIRFVPVLYRAKGAEGGPVETVFFDSGGALGYGEGSRYQNVILWADDNPHDEYIGLKNICGVTVDHLHRRSGSQ
jgi:uncharacterized protein